AEGEFCHCLSRALDLYKTISGKRKGYLGNDKKPPQLWEPEGAFYMTDHESCCPGGGYFTCYCF
ncbi:MAG TPA: hypothetical protein PK953_11735, partial [Smithellaceae bacterium]|nr:hypothetical protein [Smithellaceae bacterium]